jgi:hypothetical protein
MKTKAQILAESSLKTTQVRDSINTFVLRMSEFLLRHSNLSLTKLDQLDRFLRKLINQKIGGLPLTKEVLYIRSRDGVLGCMRYMIDITYVK